MDKKTIDHIAHLARLEISGDQSAQLIEKFAKVLTYFEQISKVDTKGIEPLVTPSEIESFWREDKVDKVFTSEDMVANAPDKVGGLFKVPPVV